MSPEKSLLRKLFLKWQRMSMLWNEMEGVHEGIKAVKAELFGVRHGINLKGRVWDPKERALPVFDDPPETSESPREE